MKENELNSLLKDYNKVDDKIKQYQDKKIIIKLESRAEILGHLAKAEHNLNFIKDTKEEYNDWILVGCYYTCYHAALALILTKGYHSKNHDATLCLIIKYFYDNGLINEDIILLNTFDTEEILFYVQSKQEREKASYTSKILFDAKLVNDIKLKTRLFFNKTKEIIKNY